MMLLCFIGGSIQYCILEVNKPITRNKLSLKYNEVCFCLYEVFAHLFLKV